MNDYLESGALLTKTIPEALSMGEWRYGPPPYTAEEGAAIDRSLSLFQTAADRIVAGKAVVHPGITNSIQGSLIAEGLEALGREHSDWQSRVSAYLKSWMAHPNPSVLLEMADILAKAGYKGEAKRTYETVLLFPSYATVFFGRGAEELAGLIVEQARSALLSL